MFIDSMLHIDISYLDEIKNDLTSMSNQIFFLYQIKNTKMKQESGIIS